jgi:hypothetical protein
LSVVKSSTVAKARKKHDGINSNKEKSGRWEYIAKRPI